MEIIARLKYSEKSDQIELSKSFEFSRLFYLFTFFKLLAEKRILVMFYPL